MRVLSKRDCLQQLDHHAFGWNRHDASIRQNGLCLDHMDVSVSGR